MIIRGETEADWAGIGCVQTAAFPGPGEAQLVDQLRADGDLRLSLVAAEGDEIVGHVAFSVMRAPFRALGLAPVAVSPGRQKAGIGAALIKAGLEQADESGWDGVFVLGDPRYYQRFGFDVAAAAGFRCRYAGAHFMVKSLGDALPVLNGEVDYAPAFAALDDAAVTETLPPQPWMTAAPTRAVIDALEAVGGPGSARFVGGCVRDALLKRPIGDIDIATPLTPDLVTQALADGGLKAVPTGIEHGTVTAIADHKPFEITTLRRDVETDGRRAVVAFTDDWAEDAARRDFRLNALYLEPDGTLHDPTSGGIADARAGRIVFVGDAETRIREDYLRILRFFRFYAWFGKGEADAGGLNACAALKEGVESLSGERVSKELLKLLAAEDPRPAVRLMASSGALSAALPEAVGLQRFDNLVEIETGMLFEDDAELRLAALLPDDKAAVTTATQRLRLSNAQRNRLLSTCSDDLRLTSWMSPREMRRAIYRLGAKAFKDRVKLAWAASDRTATYVQWRMLYTYADAWTPPPFPLDGAEIMAAGVPEGPLIGQVRREVEAWWIDLDFTDDKMAVLERLKAVAQGLAY